LNVLAYYATDVGAFADFIDVDQLGLLVDFWDLLRVPCAKGIGGNVLAAYFATPATWNAV